MSHARISIALTFFTLVAIAIAFGLYASAGRDDSHITYWAAHSIASFGEYVNFGGQRVEMSSSLLQVLILACLAYLTHIAVPGLAGILVLPLMVLGLYWTSRLASLISERASVFAIGRLATSTYWLYWSLGGLDTPYAACLAVWYCLTVHRFVMAAKVGPSDWLLIVVSMSGVALARPEGGLILLCSVGAAYCAVWLLPGLVQSQTQTKRRLLMVAMLSAILIGLFALLRLNYFDQLLPQPVYAKAGAPVFESDGVLRSGWTYFLETPIWVLPLFVAAGCGMLGLLGECVRRRRSLPVGLLLASTYIVAGVMFVYLSRGDWMEGGRFFVPLFPLLVLFAGYFFDRLPKGAWVLWGMLLGCQLVSNLEFAKGRSTGLPILAAIRAYRASADIPPGRSLSWFERVNRIHIRDIATIEPLNHWIQVVGNQRPGRVTILSRQMGMVLFHAASANFGKIDVLDRRGLADKRLLACPASRPLKFFQVGLDLDYGYLFDHWDAYQQCGIPRPDIVFDFGEEDPGVLLMHGYRLVYEQAGELRSPFQTAGDGNVVQARQWIVVREDFVPRSMVTEQRDVEFLMGE